ncbi:hypothetical protein [Candidatus Lokiarchaeum ossiferum]|uniref:hypothetical protein n=1 Tax=Candidatus Lokiarchaeum ossiferum TaxID=2951803 RepID=UPI00352D4F4D
MGIYLKLNHYYFKSNKNYEIIYEIYQIFSKLDSNNAITFPHNLIYRRPEDLTQKSIIIEEKSQRKFFDLIIELISMKISSISLFSELMVKDRSMKVINLPILISIKDINKPSAKISMQLDDNDQGFQQYYVGHEKFQIANQQDLITNIEGLIRKRGENNTTLFEHINLGENSSDFNDFNDCFYIWRRSEKKAIFHLLKSKKKLFDKINLMAQYPIPNEKIRLKIKRYKRILNYANNKYFTPKGFLDTFSLSIFLKKYQLLDKWLKNEHGAKAGSYIIPASQGELLDEVVISFARKFNSVMKKGKIPTINETRTKISKGVNKVFSLNPNEDLMDEIPSYSKLLSYVKEKEIEILSLEPEWNGKGSVSYELSTYNRAKSFLFKLVADLWKLCDLDIEMPSIFPGREGDIDLEWDLEDFQLIISISNQTDELSGIFGENRLTESELLIDFDDTFSDQKYIDLLNWIKENHK